MTESEQSQSIQMGNFQPPSLMRSDTDEGLQLIRVISDHTDFLETVRRELRGEQLYRDSTGETYWVQTDKPKFILLDKLNKPVKVYNPKTKKDEYAVNDDAVSEVLQVLKSSGLNHISPFTIIDENIIRDDLREIQSKVVVLLCLKRKEWGIDKAKYPLLCSEINTMIQDARYKAKDGASLKAMRTMTNRIEQSHDVQRNKSIGERITSPFRS